MSLSYKGSLTSLTCVEAAEATLGYTENASQPELPYKTLTQTKQQPTPKACFERREAPLKRRTL